MLLSNSNMINDPGTELLKSPQVWVSDTGSTTHLSVSKEENKNQRESTVSMTGIINGTIKPSIQIDIDCVHCDENSTN